MRNKPTLWNYSVILGVLLLLAICVVLYLAEVYVVPGPPDWLLWIKPISDAGVIIAIASSLLAALVVFLIFELGMRTVIRDILVNVITDDQVLGRIFPKSRMKKLVENSSERMLNTKEGGEAFSEILENMSKSSSASVINRSLKIIYDLDDLDGEYFSVRCNMRYFIDTLPRNFVIDAVVAHKDERNDKIHNPKSEFSWLVISDDLDRGILEDDFILEQIMVNAIKLEFNKKINGKRVVYTAPVIGEPKAGKDGFVIEIDFIAKQARRFGFVATTVKRITRDCDVEINYKNLSNVHEVWQTGFVVGIEAPTFSQRGERKTNRVTARANGWMLPNSGFCASWVESDFNPKSK